MFYLHNFQYLFLCTLYNSIPAPVFQKKEPEGSPLPVQFIGYSSVAGGSCFFFLSRMIAIAPPNNKSIAVYFLIFCISIYLCSKTQQSISKIKSERSAISIKFCVLTYSFCLFFIRIKVSKPNNSLFAVVY